MIGIQTELKLANLLKAVADGEKQIEVTRQVLAEQPEFEPYTAFKRIDRLINGNLHSLDIHRFLRDNDIYVTERDCENLVKLYDSNNDGKLSYTEFLDLVLPNTSPALRKLATSRPSYYVGRYDQLPYEAEWALARVINKEIDFFRKIELLKEDLTNRYDFNTLDAFKVIDIDRFGFINHDSIYFFLKRNHILATDDDVLAILRRIDLDGCGKINYSDFVDAILPIDPYYRKAYRPMTTSIDIPKMRSTSPVRKTNARLSAEKFYTPSKSHAKLTNSDYIDYLNTSSRKSPIRNRSPSPSRSKKIEEDILKDTIYNTPTRNRRELSPSRISYSANRRVGSPMKGLEENHLANALKDLIENDKELENIKNDLALKSDFNLLDGFRIFDLQGKGYITRSELEEGFKEFGVYPSSTELYLIMRKYDSDNDSLLKYSDWCDMVTAKSLEYSSILTKRIPLYADEIDVDRIFLWDTKKQIGRVLTSIISNEVTSEAIRQKLNRRPLFNVYEAFKALDKADIGAFSLEEFKELLLDHGIYATSKDVLNLVERFDKNHDGKVTYSEFVSEITPKSPTRIY